MWEAQSSFCSVIQINSNVDDVVVGVVVVRAGSVLPAGIVGTMLSENGGGGAKDAKQWAEGNAEAPEISERVSE